MKVRKKAFFEIFIIILFIIIALSLGGCNKKEMSQDESVVFITQSSETSDSSNSLVEITDLSGIISYRNDCINISEKMKHSITNGNLLLYKMYNGSDIQTIDIFNTKSNEKYKLNNENELIYEIHLSPDRSRIAYQSFSKFDSDTRNELVVMNFVTGDEIRFLFDENWQITGTLSWLNNDELLIMPYKHNMPGYKIDIMSGEKTMMPFDFEKELFKKQEETFLIPKYNPANQLVIFPSIINDQNYYVIRNIANNENVDLIPTSTFMTFIAPSWSNNGKNFILSVMPQETKEYTFELYYMNLEQNVNKITNLNEYYKSYYFKEIVWSPNDQYVAVIVRDTEDINNQIDYFMVVDVLKNQIFDYCIPVNYSNWIDGYSVVEYPIWSPDSKQVIVEYQFDYGKNEVILIDLLKKEASVILNDEQVLGWVKSSN